TGGQWVRFHVRSEGTTEIDGLIQDARFIDADLSFTELAIKEKNTSDFSKNWTQDASTVHISDASIVTDYLFQDAVKLAGAKISVEKIDESEVKGESGDVEMTKTKESDKDKKEQDGKEDKDDKQGKKDQKNESKE